MPSESTIQKWPPRILLPWALALLMLSSCEEHSPLEILASQGIPVSPESLISATKSNQAYLVQLLTGAGVLPDECRDQSGQTPLMLAARHGYEQVVDLLSPHSRDLDLVDERGMTALSHSICNGQLKIAEYLLKSGAQANVNCHLQQPLLVMAVMQSQIPAFELLLEYGANSGIDDALLIAVTERKYELAKKLIACGASANAGAEFQMPVLNIALQNGDRASVELLLAAGADPNHRDDDGMNALGYAIAERDSGLLSTLLAEGGDPELPCEEEFTPTELAVSRVMPELLSKLLSEGDAVIHPRVVTDALDGGSPEVLAVLLDHGAYIDTPDSRGDTLLARAIRAGDAPQAKLLLQRGANAEFICKEGQSLLALATALKSPACVTALLDAGADANQRLDTPISEAYRALVGSRTFSFYAKRDSRFTPIMVAASHGHPDTVRALIRGGASNNRHTRSYKRYPISFASEAGNIEAQQLIVGYDPLTCEDSYKIVIDLSLQRAVLYKNGSVYQSSKVSTGKSGYRTPTGEYVVTHKHRTWTSTLYHSSMPYFMRLSCKAFGTHVGYVPNYPASHGCIRMPHNNAKAFFNAAPRGTTVSIVD